MIISKNVEGIRKSPFGNLPNNNNCFRYKLALHGRTSGDTQ